MNKFFASLLLILFPLLAAAQSAQGRYVSRMTQDGKLIFIEPKKISVCSEIKKFEYDVTCLTWADSATVNFTFVSRTISKPRDLKIKSCGSDYVCDNYSLLYTDIVKSGYEIRVSAKYPVADIEKIFQCETSPVFSFKQDDIERTAAYSKSAWAKDRVKLNAIMNLYNTSK